MNRRYSRKIQAIVFVVFIVPLLILSYGILNQFGYSLFSESGAAVISWTLIIGLLIAVTISKKVTNHVKLETEHFSQLDTFDGLDEALISKINLISNENLRLQKLLMDITQKSDIQHEALVKIDTLILEEKSRISIIEHNLDMMHKISDNIMDLTTQYLIWVDHNGVILKINKSFMSRLGYQLDDIKGKNIQDFLESALIDIDENKGQTDDFVSQLKSGSQKPILLAFRMKSTAVEAYEYMSVSFFEHLDGTYLCIGKAVNDEIALQSNILRKNRELEYINQINASLVSNWDIDALLDNIIKRIDYLFNIKFGGIYIYDDSDQWMLKSFTSKYYAFNEVERLNLEGYFLSIDSQIQTYQVNLEQMKYLIVSPLIVDDRTIAIISIAIDQVMNSNDINILNMFKNQTAMVIQRAIIYDQLRVHYLGTIEALVNVIEAKDKYTEGHSRRVSRFSVELAKEMGYSNEEIENIEIAGLLHDIGKIGIDYNILTKQGKLTSEEYEIIKQHPTKGAQILDAISLETNIKEGILYHHLRYDLTGYPKADIASLPKYACIIGIADAFDAITSARSYNKARSMNDAIEELVRHEGRQFDPQMVRVFQKLFKENPMKLQRIIDDIDY
jgi:putative nucleotidyltransferase with HDIG domain